MHAEGLPDRNTSSLAVDADGRVTLPQRVPGANTLYVIDEFEAIHEQRITLLPGPNPEIVVTVPDAATRR